MFVDEFGNNCTFIWHTQVSGKSGTEGAMPVSLGSYSLGSLFPTLFFDQGTGPLPKMGPNFPNKVLCCPFIKQTTEHSTHCSPVTEQSREQRSQRP